MNNDLQEQLEELCESFDMTSAEKLRVYSLIEDQKRAAQIEVLEKAQQAITSKVENERKWGHDVLESEQWWLKGLELARDEYIDTLIQELKEQV